MIPQNVTNISGTIAVAATSTSKGIEAVMTHAPTNAEPLINAAHNAISLADKVGICSVCILGASFLYTIFSTRKRHRDIEAQLEIDKKFYTLRKEELELEKAKFKKGLL